MSGPAPTTTRAPDSALASALKAGSVGYLAAKLGEAIGQAWINPVLLSSLAAADGKTLADLSAAAPLVMGAAMLGAVSFLGTAARDFAFVAGARWAKFIGKVAP